MSGDYSREIERLAAAAASSRDAAQLAMPNAAAFDRFVILDEATSTQDEARVRCGGRAGMMVMALSQTAGRGRLGREWKHAAAKGVAATFVVNVGQCDAASASLRAGVAALDAANVNVPVSMSSETLGIRWPNDVVLRSATRRKLAGVLVERHGELLLIGIGINVLQERGDWPVQLQGSAISLAMLLAERDEGHAAAGLSIFAVAEHLVASLTWALAMAMPMVLDSWQRANVLRGATQTFEYNNARFTGVVEEIQPGSEIALRLVDGTRVLLPAMSTSMVHD
jgi:BirA family biotin operon repressor/biotin-[acetyl-CoA-carboxylase] ligase